MTIPIVIVPQLKRTHRFIFCTFKLNKSFRFIQKSALSFVCFLSLCCFPGQPFLPDYQSPSLSIRLLRASFVA